MELGFSEGQGCYLKLTRVRRQVKLESGKQTGAAGDTAVPRLGPAAWHFWATVSASEK